MRWKLILPCLVLASMPAFAIQDPQSSAPPQTANAGQIPTPEEVVQRLGEKLSLTDDQKAKILPIIVDRRQQLQDLRDDTSERKMRKARKLKQIFESSDKKIKAVLSDDQKQKYAAMEQQMHEEIRQRMQQRQSQLN